MLTDKSPSGGRILSSRLSGQVGSWWSGDGYCLRPGADQICLGPCSRLVRYSISPRGAVRGVGAVCRMYKTRRNLCLSQNRLTHVDLLLCF